MRSLVAAKIWQIFAYFLASAILLGGYALLSSPSLFAYGSLAEFISPDHTSYRAEGDTVFSADEVVTPVWPAASFPLSLTLCQNSSFTSAVVRYQTGKASEVLADIQAAQTSWTFGSSTLAFSAPAGDAACPAFSSGAFSTYSSSHSVVGFTSSPPGLGTSLPPDVLAYTPLTLQITSGTLEISGGNIYFNPTIAFATQACILASSRSGTCIVSSSTFSFLGVLTHEMGHFIGLSHSMVNDDNITDGLNTTATMFPVVNTLSESQDSETLTTDDRLARESLYPSSGFPDSSVGSVSGWVKDVQGNGLRGAHVTVFDTQLERTIAGTFSGISGTFGNPDGSYSIVGIPLATDFIVFVEPPDRTDVNDNLTSAAYNTPIYLSVLAGLTPNIFQIEAYPDTPIADLRRWGSVSASPGISAAQVFRLTSGARHQTDVNFYVSETRAAPNDATGVSIEINSSTLITTDNPLTITLSNPLGLSSLADSTITLTARASGASSSLDWSGGVPAFDFSQTSSSVIVDSSVFTPANGTYAISVKISSPTYGDISEAFSITVRDWEGTGEISGQSSSGKGGCSLQTVASDISRDLAGLFGLTLMVLGLIRRRVRISPPLK